MTHEEKCAALHNSLPHPACQDGLGEICPGPFETVVSECRPGEIDASVRCRECQSCAHHVVDAETFELLDDAALLKKRREASGVRRQEPADDRSSHAPRGVESGQNHGHEDKGTLISAD